MRVEEGGSIADHQNLCHGRTERTGCDIAISATILSENSLELPSQAPKNVSVRCLSALYIIAEPNGDHMLGSLTTW